MEAAVDSIPVAIACIDSSQRFRFCNRAFEKWFAADREEIAGLSVLEVAGEDIYRRVAAYLEQAQSGEQVGFDIRTPSAQGGEYELSVACLPHTTTDGAVDGFFALVSDVSTESVLTSRAQHREARLQAVLDATVDGIVTMSAAGIIESCNPSVERILGYRSHELRGQPIEMLMPEPYRSKHAGYLGNYLAGGEASIIGVGREVAGLRKDGTTCPLYLAVAETEVDGERLFTGILRDITAQKRLQDELTELNAHLEARVKARAEELVREAEEHAQTRALLERVTSSARCLLWHGEVREDDGELTWDIRPVSSGAAQRLLPLDGRRGEAWHQTAYRARLPEDSVRADAVSRHALLNGLSEYSQDLRSVDRNGALKWLHEDVYIEQVAQGRWQVTGVTTDVTERTLAAIEARESEERLALAQRAANFGSWDWNIVTNGLHWSDQIEPMFGFEPGGFGRTYEAFLDLVHPEDRQAVIDAVDAAVYQGEPYAIEHRIVWPDGSVRWVAESGEVHHNSQGEPVRMIGAVRDVTSRREAESEIRDANARLEDALRQVFTIQEEERARISRELHDQVGQELTSVLLGLRVIEAADALDDVREQAGELRTVTSNTLEDVRQIAFDMRPSSLDDLGIVAALGRDLELLAQSAAFETTLHAHNPEDVSLPAETEVGLYRMIHGALTNIVRHARAGNVGVVLRIHGADDARVASALIQDDGVGFDVEKVLGGPVEGRFGLLSLQERAKLMGGQATFESVEGEGSTVLLDVPIPPASPE